MFQLKISAAILVVVLALMGFAYFALSESVTQSIVKSEVEELSLARRSVSDLRYLAELSLRERVEPLSSDPVVVKELGKLRMLASDAGGFEPLKRQSNRVDLFDHLMQWRDDYDRDLNEKLENFKGQGAAFHDTMADRSLADWWGASPDLVLAFVATPLRHSRTGHVLVAYAEKGQELQGGRDYAEPLPVLVLAEETQSAQIDVISWASFEYLVVASPVFDAEGFLIGTVVIGYQLGSEIVDRLASATDETHLVIIFSGERLYTQESGKVKEKLFNATFHPVEIEEESASVDTSRTVEFDGIEVGKPYYVEVDGQRFLLERQDWLSDPTGPRVGLFVLGDYQAAVKPVESLRYQIPLVGAVILVVGLIIIMVVIRSFLRPIEAIDVGIQEILAGNKDYVFRASSGNPLHGELVNSLNQLSAFLQGKDAPGESSGWDELMVDLEPERPSIYGMQAVQVVQDPQEKEKLRALYDEYMSKRKEMDQWVDMDFDRFCRRIKRNENKLKEQHSCSSVEFSVAVADGKVVLKPKPIFD